MDRFWAKVDRSGGPSACWPWLAARTARGYGRFKIDGKTVRAHRYAYEQTTGAIPPGWEIDHTCANPPCVNPVHLRAVPAGFNGQQGAALGGKNGGGLANRRKTHCPQGHPYRGRNLYAKPSGRRVCRRCDNEASRRYRRKGVS